MFTDPCCCIDLPQLPTYAWAKLCPQSGSTPVPTFFPPLFVPPAGWVKSANLIPLGYPLVGDKQPSITRADTPVQLSFSHYVHHSKSPSLPLSIT